MMRDPAAIASDLDKIKRLPALITVNRGRGLMLLTAGLERMLRAAEARITADSRERDRVVECDFICDYVPAVLNHEFVARSHVVVGDHAPEPRMVS
jgi:hypothetical protein